MNANECIRCGMCCLAAPCPPAIGLAGHPDRPGPCDFLRFHPEGLAICQFYEHNKQRLDPRLFAHGEGCSISATVISEGHVADFDSLDDTVKFFFANALRTNNPRLIAVTKTSSRKNP